MIVLVLCLFLCVYCFKLSVLVQHFGKHLLFLIFDFAFEIKP